MAGTVTDVTDNNFQAEVLESDVPVLVDFWAPWCGPCRRVSPVVEEIANERGEALKVVKLNIDENQQTAIKFNVMSIPTLMLFKHGQLAKTVIGAYPKRKLEAELEPALTSASRLQGDADTYSSRPSIDDGRGSRPATRSRRWSPAPRRRCTPDARGRRRAAARRRRASARSGRRPRGPRPGARALHRADDLARPALDAQLVVDLELERDRVRALALDLVALERLHRDQQVVGVELVVVARRPRLIPTGRRAAPTPRGPRPGRRPRPRRSASACRTAGRACGSWA